MRKKAAPQELLDLSVYADEVIDACMGALLILADEGVPDDRRTPKTRKAGAPEDR